MVKINLLVCTRVRSPNVYSTVYLFTSLLVIVLVNAHLDSTTSMSYPRFQITIFLKKPKQ